MTSACLTLLAQAAAAIWPWARTSRGTLFVEAFPAAQLLTWGLPFQGYNGNRIDDRKNRGRIVEYLRSKMRMAAVDDLVNSADALDAVIAAFAGIAVKEKHLCDEPPGPECAEGWIAVHGDARAAKSERAETMNKR
jgi:hypothetical protein